MIWSKIFTVLKIVTGVVLFLGRSKKVDDIIKDTKDLKDDFDKFKKGDSYDYDS